MKRITLILMTAAALLLSFSAAAQNGPRGQLKVGATT